MTYDLLADTAPPPRPPGKKDDAAAAGRRLHDAARKLYREAVKANDGDGPPAPELAAAAHDAARGLKHFATATRPVDPDLPRPPAGPRDADPWEQARGDLRRAKERLAKPEADGGPAGKEFRDAAKKAYTAGREAYEAKEYDKATELARAAEAWSHVGEHLDRAKDGKDDKPPPPPADAPKRGEKPLPELKGKPEPKRNEVPPAPPPLSERGRSLPGRTAER